MKYMKKNNFVFFYLHLIFLSSGYLHTLSNNLSKNMRLYIWDQAKRYNNLNAAVKCPPMMQYSVMDMITKINDLKMLKIVGLFPYMKKDINKTAFKELYDHIEEVKGIRNKKNEINKKHFGRWKRKKIIKKE